VEFSEKRNSRDPSQLRPDNRQQTARRQRIRDIW